MKNNLNLKSNVLNCKSPRTVEQFLSFVKMVTKPFIFNIFFMKIIIENYKQNLETMSIKLVDYIHKYFFDISDMIRKMMNMFLKTAMYYSYHITVHESNDRYCLLCY